MAHRNTLDSKNIPVSCPRCKQGLFPSDTACQQCQYSFYEACNAVESFHLNVMGLQVMMQTMMERGNFAVARSYVVEKLDSVIHLSLIFQLDRDNLVQLAEKWNRRKRCD